MTRWSDLGIDTDAANAAAVLAGTRTLLVGSVFLAVEGVRVALRVDGAPRAMLTLGKSVELDATRFEELRSRHGLSDEERAARWPDAQTLWGVEVVKAEPIEHKGEDVTKAGAGSGYAPVRPGTPPGGWTAPLALEDVQGHFKSFVLRRGAVMLVGSVANEGVTHGGLDVLVQGPFDPTTRAIIEHRLNRMLPTEVGARMRVMGGDGDPMHDAGPISAHLPLYDIVLRRTRRKKVIAMRDNPGAALAAGASKIEHSGASEAGGAASGAAPASSPLCSIGKYAVFAGDDARGFEELGAALAYAREQGGREVSLGVWKVAEQGYDELARSAPVTAGARYVVVEQKWASDVLVGASSARVDTFSLFMVERAPSSVDVYQTYWHSFVDSRYTWGERRQLLGVDAGALFAFEGVVEPGGRVGGVRVNPTAKTSCTFRRVAEGRLQEVAYFPDRVEMRGLSGALAGFVVKGTPGEAATEWHLSLDPPDYGVRDAPPAEPHVCHCCGAMAKQGGELEEATEELGKAVWSRAYVNSLADSCFLYVESGGSRDSDGKTTPRSLRHFPVRDASGKIDLPHLRNALARIPQADLPADVKSRLKAKAERMLATATGRARKSDPVSPSVLEFGGKRLVLEESHGVRLVKAQAPTANDADEERFVLGVVLEPQGPDDPTPAGHVEDTQGDCYDADEVRKAAWRYMEVYQTVGLMHEKRLDNRVAILESYLAPVDFVLDGGEKVKKGTWLLGARILDDALWAQVKSGELDGWSIGGFAVREPQT